ncbi:MAG: hypothetical protein HQL86_01205 [Magnetococcales bacterium]|nr:hypothetical protein [Magnetococcales bacterium]
MIEGEITDPTPGVGRCHIVCELFPTGFKQEIDLLRVLSENGDAQLAQTPFDTDHPFRVDVGFDQGKMFLDAGDDRIEPFGENGRAGGMEGDDRRAPKLLVADIIRAHQFQGGQAMQYRRQRLGAQRLARLPLDAGIPQAVGQLGPRLDSTRIARNCKTICSVAVN